MRAALRHNGCVLIGQTGEIAPADRRLYALRDVTATVESLPLICASILSKKIAEGIGALVLDVKVGRGAFLKSDDEARELASWLVRIAARQGVRARALLTRMDAPLGRAVGNANEVIEAIETLKGRGPKETESLSVRLAGEMLVLAGVAGDHAAAEARIRQALDRGDGVEKLRDIIGAQGGDSRVIDDFTRLPRPRLERPWRASRSGVVARLDAELIGRAAVVLGAGRDRVEASIDPAAGVTVVAAVGDRVTAGEPILLLAGNDDARMRAADALIAEAIEIGDDEPLARPLVLDVIDERQVAVG
jgi:pyrimidine-nucleoside phosphorylase